MAAFEPFTNSTMEARNLSRLEAISTSRPRITPAPPGSVSGFWVIHRDRLPLDIHPISAGVRGGIAGSIAMAVLAMTYGVISGHGVWYPVNLLSAGFFPERTSIAQIAAFHWNALIIAAVIHTICSLLVGLLYGLTLPLAPRRPILLGAAIAPIMLSALLHSIIEGIDPGLQQRINWPWFVIAQIGYGMVAGVVVLRRARIPGSTFRSRATAGATLPERAPNRTKTIISNDL